MAKGMVNAIQLKKMQGVNSHKQNIACLALLQNAWYLFRKYCSREVPWSDTTQETFLETTCIKFSS